MKQRLGIWRVCVPHCYRSTRAAPWSQVITVIKGRVVPAVSYFQSTKEGEDDFFCFPRAQDSSKISHCEKKGCSWQIMAREWWKKWAGDQTVFPRENGCCPSSLLVLGRAHQIPPGAKEVLGHPWQMSLQWMVTHIQQHLKQNWRRVKPALLQDFAGSF